MDFGRKLEDVEKTYVELERLLTLPEVVGNPHELQRTAKKHSDLAPIVDAWRLYQAALVDLKGAREIFDTDDSEMKEMAREEIGRLENVISNLENQIGVLLIPKDPNDDRSVIVEIRGGAGGEEAALFAANLYRMYVRFAERQGWSTELMTMNETGIGGFKEVAFRIPNEGAYSQLKYESGVHRVQRVPLTEASGRIHTSTATVAVLPEADEVDVQINTEDLKIDTYRASGAGGQYVNMTDSAVRITHIPSGVVVSCQDERSQLKNRVKAMTMLRAKLYDSELQKQQEALASERRGQIGTADRSERIRTYNFPQNRLTDHRIGLTLYKLDQVMDGDLRELIDALNLADQAEKLKNLES
jgi:peptide chain release factor 1